MRFTPKTKEELATEGLLPEGIYPFSVTKAEEKVSKKGNDMIKLSLRVFGLNGREQFIYDYLMEAFPSKLAEFCEVVGLDGKYNAGSLTDDDCEGKEGYVEVKIEKANGEFGPKNVVRGYCSTAAPASKAPGRTDAERLRNPGTGLDDSMDALPF